MVGKYGFIYGIMPNSQNTSYILNLSQNIEEMQFDCLDDMSFHLHDLSKLNFP